LDVRTLRRTGAVVLLLAFGILLGLWVRSRLPAFDQAILDFAVAHRTAAWTNFFRAAALCGGTPAVTVITVVVAVAAVWRRWWTLAGQAVVAGVGTAVLVVAGKSAFGRPRPPAATQLGVLQSLSYPSGHALGSMVAATLLLALVFAASRAGPWRVLAVLLVAVYIVWVGLSRLYLGVHWGSDVLGGWAIGAAWGLLCLGLPGRQRKTWPPALTASQEPAAAQTASDAST